MEQTGSALVVRNKHGILYDEELAQLLKIRVSTLKNRRSKGDAPPSAKIGRDHITMVDDFKQWIARKRAR